MIVLVDGAERAELAATLVVGLRARAAAGEQPSPAVLAFVRELRDRSGQLRDRSGQNDAGRRDLTDDGVMDLNSAARILDLSTRTVRRRVDDGRLTARRDGRRLVFECAELRRYIDSLESA